MNTAIVREILGYQVRFLTFRGGRPNLENHAGYYLGYGLLVTWLAGIGRYWDNPRAELWQHLGLGSLAYVFTLALLIYLIVMPLRPRNWSYRNVLIFICLTSLPALLYAIPVERFMTLEGAQAANAGFLAVVAVWRVALYINFLRTAARLSVLKIIVATLLPLALIVVALTLLNLEHVIFDIMAGIREADQGPNDTAYMVVLVLGVLSYFGSPVLALAYLAMVAMEARKFYRERRGVSA